MRPGPVMLIAASVALTLRAPALSQSGGGYELIGGVVECRDASMRGAGVELHATWCREASTSPRSGRPARSAAASDSRGVVELELAVLRVSRAPDHDAIGIDDLVGLLGSWGTDAGGPADLDRDGQVGAADLAQLVSRWGDAP